MQYLKLGASLYVPANNDNLEEVLLNKKFPSLKSLIIDLEDSVHDNDLEKAYNNIQILLNKINKLELLVFIRARSTESLQKLYTFESIEKITGFVLPKFSTENMEAYFKNLNKNMLYMPILEKNIFKVSELEKICDFVLPFKKNILSIRIGATDILSTFSCRRSHKKTIYEIAIMRQIISNIIITFKPYDFNITGCVFESFDKNDFNILEQEVEEDLLNGLFGKTIIHPSQIDIVQNIYKVKSLDYKLAKSILDETKPFIFKEENIMNEKATHINWAKKIIAMSEIYGIRD
ncbi:MAG: HpcH/HpaI aldolase/citrate lyase family protein [Candidatus Sericytochromatia bacterium]